MTLAGRRIVVTRPAMQADALLAALRAEQADVQSLPLLVIEPLAADEPAMQAAVQCLQAIAGYQHIIFISTNAVAQGLAVFNRLGVPWPAAAAVYAIGRATAEALAAAGIQAEQAEGKMNSEALLAKPGLQAVAGQKVLIVRGEGGRSHLADTLGQRGADVDVAETYRRRCPQYDHEVIASAFSPAPDAIVVNSGETLKNLAVYVQGMAPVREVALIVPSQRVAAIATTLGFSRVLTAANASDAAIMHALHCLDESTD